MAASITIAGRRRVSSSELVWITVLVLLSALLRGWGLNYGLPYLYHPDEPSYIAISQRIFRTADLNPHFFNYPSLFFYINALAYVPYYLIGRLFGVFYTTADILPPISLAMGVSQAPMPTAALLGRMVTASFGIGAVVLVYLAGKQLTGKPAVATLAALMVATSPTAVSHSRFVTPDTFVVFFSLATFLLSVLVYQDGKTWQYVAAGLCAGLTASTKYNGALIISVLIAAHFLRYGKSAYRQPRLYLALLCSGLGFLATTPFAVFDFSKFLSDFTFEARHYSSGHAGMEGETLRWYLNYMWNTSGGLYVLALPGIVYGCIRHPKAMSLLLIFPSVYFVFIANMVVRNDRTFLPLVPFLFLVPAWFSVDVLDKIKTAQRGSFQTLALVAFASMICIALISSASKTIVDTRQLTTVNSRETARIWISENLPPGARIAIESYAPFVDPVRFSVQGFWRLIDHDPEWYRAQGFEFLVFSQGMYGRFYREPERYREEVSRYEAFWSYFSPLMIFTDGGYEVRIYQVR